MKAKDFDQKFDDNHHDIAADLELIDQATAQSGAQARERRLPCLGYRRPRPRGRARRRHPSVDHQALAGRAPAV